MSTYADEVLVKQAKKAVRRNAWADRLQIATGFIMTVGLPILLVISLTLSSSNHATLTELRNALCVTGTTEQHCTKQQLAKLQQTSQKQFKAFTCGIIKELRDEGAITVAKPGLCGLAERRGAVSSSK